MAYDQLTLIDPAPPPAPKPKTVRLEVPAEHSEKLRAYLKSLTTPPKGLVVFSPTFVTVGDGNKTNRYLIEPDPVTQEDSDLIDGQIETLMKEFRRCKTKREDGLLYAIAAIAKRVGEEVTQ